jgi:hypothetical protein
MPTQGEILGFANRWTPLALETAQQQAFRGRGQGGFLFSHDLENLMAVVDGHASLLEECRLSLLELRNDLADQFLELLNTSAFLESLPAFLPLDQASRCWLAGDCLANRKAPRAGRLGAGCGGHFLTPRTAGRVSEVHAWPALCLTGEEWGSRLGEEMLGA